MDNLSHTLAGLGVAELVSRSLPAEADAARARTRHRLLLVAGALASSFPDLDIVLSPLLPAPLGYLLHHRGHTHTLLYALPQALLVCALLWLSWPGACRLLQASRHARLGLVLVLVACFGLHLAMDFLNSYGIHPFHPFDSGWLYGDMVFIIEPVFWVALGVPLCMQIERAWLRAALLVLPAALLAYFAAAGFLHWASLLGLYALGALLGAIRHGTRSRGPVPGVLAGFAALALFLGMQGMATGHAKRVLERELTALDPAAAVLDTARTAFPANPLCWVFVSVEADEAADRYRLRRGVLALTPLPVAQCPAALAERSLQRTLGPQLALLDQHEGSLSALRALHARNCHFEAWMRFARAPRIDGGVAADMRFAASNRANFTALDLDALQGAACPRPVPRWDFPRADLLGAEH